MNCLFKLVTTDNCYSWYCRPSFANHQCSATFNSRNNYNIRLCFASIPLTQINDSCHEVVRSKMFSAGQHGFDFQERESSCNYVFRAQPWLNLQNDYHNTKG